VGTNCDCSPGYQAQVWSPTDRKTIRKTFPTLADARAWRSDTQSALRQGTLHAPARITLAEAAAEWLAAAQDGIVRTRSGEIYKPSALRAYEQALRTRVLPALGHLKLSAITRPLIQDLVDQLIAERLAPSTIRNAILPVRAIYRRALSRSQVHTNPTLGLRLPAVAARRKRVARPAEAREALPQPDRAFWATALYAGLRRGELQALRWQDIDFDADLIRVERGWTPKPGRSHRKAAPADDEYRSPDPYASTYWPTDSSPSTTGSHSPSPTRAPRSPNGQYAAHELPGNTRASTDSGYTNAATPTPPT
jgi:integrase